MLSWDRCDAKQPIVVEKNRKYLTFLEQTTKMKNKM